MNGLEIVITLGVLIAVLVSAIACSGKKTVTVQPEAYIIQNVHLIDGNGGEEFNRNVLIKDRKIVKISADRLTAENVQVIDGSGKTLMPGLIDSHTHLQGITNRSEKESDEFLKKRIPEIFHDLLKNGVTTIKELGAPESFIFKLKDKINSKEITGPDLLIVGPNITAKGGHPAVTLGGDNPWIREEMAEEVKNEQQARQTVKRLADKKADFIKIVYQGGKYFYFENELVLNKLDINLVKAIIDEAKKYNLKVTAHVAHEADVLELLQTDIYGLEHGVVDKYISDDDEVMELWKSKGIYYVPTIQILAGDHNKDVVKYGMYNLKKLHDYGVKIALGTDNMLEILSGKVVHKELEYYVEAGLTEMEALVTATRNSADYLGILDKTGTVEESKNADLILLDSDPLEDIQNVNNINIVFKDGNIVYSKTDSKQAILDDYTFSSFETLTYIDNTLAISKNAIEKKYTLNRFSTSGIIKLDYLDNSNSVIQETFRTKKNLETTEWSYAKPSDGTDIKAIAKEDSIILTGKFKNKEVDKKYLMDSEPWMQMSVFNLSPFVKSKHEKISYFGIGTDGRGALNLTKFDSQKEGTETIEVEGKKYECSKVSTVLSEYPFIWKGYSWYDKEDGALIRFTVKGKEADSMDIKNNF